MESPLLLTKGAHIRIEEPRREGLDKGRAGSPFPGPVAAFGICLSDIFLGPDERVRVESGGSATGNKWFGRKFRKMETSLLGNVCECCVPMLEREVLLVGAKALA